MLLLCFFLIITLVKHNILVVNGARYGLMLWYQNVIPLLLPFMIISNLCLMQAKKRGIKHNYTPVIYIILLGTLCGYPLGAKCTADFVSNNFLSKSYGNLLLPLCNNVSPMFLSGYICHFVLTDSIPFLTCVFLLYIPYIFVFIISFLYIYLTGKREEASHSIYKENIAINQSINSNPKVHFGNDDLLLNSIHQITYVGIYIMLCSILINLISAKLQSNESTKAILAGIIEVTQGSVYLDTAFSCLNIKTALILGMTSFGGVSSILQTYQVIKQSGLSLIYYILVKIICGITTGMWCYLLVI